MVAPGQLAGLDDLAGIFANELARLQGAGGEGTEPPRRAGRLGDNRQRIKRRACAAENRELLRPRGNKRNTLFPDRKSSSRVAKMPEKWRGTGNGGACLADHRGSARQSRSSGRSGTASPVRLLPMRTPRSGRPPGRRLQLEWGRRGCGQSSSAEPARPSSLRLSLLRGFFSLRPGRHAPRKDAPCRPRKDARMTTP